MPDKEDFKTILKILSFPLILLAMFLILTLIWNIFNLPSLDEFVNIVTNFFDKYGIIVIFISSLIEGLLLIGNYFPGGFVIFIGIISAGESVLKAANIIIFVSAGLFIAYLINYFVGKYGWYKLFLKLGLKKQIEKSKDKLASHAFSTIFLSYWIPNLAAITATAAGIMGVEIKKFISYSAMAVILWTSILGIAVFIIGQAILDIASNVYYIIIIFLVWALIITAKYYLWDKKH